MFSHKLGSMKLLLVLFTLTISLPVFSEEESRSFCNPPSDHLFKEKLKKWFHTEKLERELREVIAFSENSTRRETVKGLRRRTYFADRFLEEDLRKSMQAEFQSMVAADPRRAGAMENFPVRGAVSELQGGEDGTLDIRATAIPLEDQSLLSPEVRSKLGNSIRISYHYPIDKFEYFLTYEGEEHPFEKTIGRIKDGYEMECVEFANRQKAYRESGSGSRSGRGGSSQ